MGRHKNREEWIKWFEKFEKSKIDFNWNEYYEYMWPNVSHKFSEIKIKKMLRKTFQAKLKKYNKSRNDFMIKEFETRGRKKVDNTYMKHKDKNREKEVDEFLNRITDKQKTELARLYLIEKAEKEEESKKKKKINSLKGLFNKTEIAFILGEHRTTQYKAKKQRTYKFEPFKDIVISIFNENNRVYGSERISAELKRTYEIYISPRTLRNYMKMWGLVVKIRQKRRKSEQKDTNVTFVDHVKRNFNPEHDNIVATDVTYIPAYSHQNFVYLSVCISHKTKLIESWQLSEVNDLKLVWDTLVNIRERADLIVHSDHGFQYSHKWMIDLAHEKNYSISMGRIGNSLDNREVEYFFSNIKSECLNTISTSKMKIDEIRIVVQEYIDWYNNERIQKNLGWLSPIEYSNQNSINHISNN